MNTLEVWSETVTAELGIEAGMLDRDAVLDVAKNTAHDVVRPAAPLTTYLLGVAVGKGLPLAEAAEKINALAAAWAEQRPEEPQ